MKKIKVDAMGDQCPIPVIKTKKALKEITETTLVEVHVDNEIAVQNLSKMAKQKNLEYKCEKLEEQHYIIKINAEAEGVTIIILVFYFIPTRSSNFYNFYLCTFFYFS